MSDAKSSESILLGRQAVAAVGGNLTLARELVRRFLQQLSSEQGELAQGSALVCLETLRAKVHKLSSGGLYLGFFRVGQAARTLESLIDNNAPQETLAQALGDLNRAIRETLEQPEEVLLSLLLC